MPPSKLNLRNKLKAATSKYPQIVEKYSYFAEKFLELKDNFSRQDVSFLALLETINEFLYKLLPEKGCVNPTLQVTTSGFVVLHIMRSA